jgi:tetratricopeptide (TPR) repeat protein
MSYRRAALYEETDKLDESLEDFKKVLELDPANHDARAAQVRLPPLINDRNEKMKAEMMDKLKDLGNMILRPFGLSTSNFELKQDPSSGSYSVNFNQKPPQ